MVSVPSPGMTALGRLNAETTTVIEPLLVIDGVEVMVFGASRVTLFPSAIARNPTTSQAPVFWKVQALTLLSISLASVSGVVLAVIATERILLPPTVTELIDVLLTPVISMTLVRGEAMRGKLNGMLVGVAGGAGEGSTCVAWQAPVEGVAAAASAALLHQRSVANIG